MKYWGWPYLGVGVCFQLINVVLYWKLLYSCYVNSYTMYNEKLLNQVKKLVTIPVNHNTATLEEKIEMEKEKIEKYMKVGFKSVYSSKHDAIIKPLERKLTFLEGENKLAGEVEKYRDLGYLVIRDPEWDGYFGYTDSWRGKRKTQYTKTRNSDNQISCKILSKTLSIPLPFGYRFDPEINFSALWCVPIERFIGEVPDFVLEKVMSERKKKLFCQYDIFFVAKRSEVNDMVNGLYRAKPIDPILVGRWSVGVKYRYIGIMPGFKPKEDYEAWAKFGEIPIPSSQGCVLAMWGDDLEEIDLALLS